MGKVQTTVQAGACGFVTKIAATCDDGQKVQFEVDSPCETVQRLALRLPEVDAFSEIASGFDGAIHQAARATHRGCCSGCVVPIAFFKTMQAAAGIALPRPVAIEMEASEE